MSRLFVSDGNLLLNAHVASTIQLRVFPPVAPFTDVEIWQPHKDGPKHVRRARVLGAREMNLCDVPEWVFDMHYDPSRRTFEDCLAALQAKGSKKSRGGRVWVTAIVFQVV